MIINPRKDTHPITRRGCTHMHTNVHTCTYTCTQGASQMLEAMPSYSSVYSKMLHARRCPEA